MHTQYPQLDRINDFLWTKHTHYSIDESCYPHFQINWIIRKPTLIQDSSSRSSDAESDQIAFRLIHQSAIPPSSLSKVLTIITTIAYPLVKEIRCSNHFLSSGSLEIHYSFHFTFDPFLTTMGISSSKSAYNLLASRLVSTTSSIMIHQCFIGDISLAIKTESSQDWCFGSSAVN